MRVTRRQAMRGMGVVAAAAASGWALAGCATAAKTQQPAPSPYAGAQEVPFQLWTPAVPVNATSKALIQGFVDKTFNSKQKGIRATWVGGGNMSGVAASALAGSKTTPWVVASCCGDWPVILPFLERLDPYFRADNIDTTTTWHKGQLSRFREPDGVYGLPEDAASDAYLYRMDLLDQLGLPYPDATWDYTQAQSLWQRCTGRDKSNRWRYGVACPFGSGTTEGVPTVVAGFGGAFQNTDRTVCLLNSQDAIKAGEYWLHMVWNKVATNGDGSPNPGVFNGTCVFTTAAEPTIIDAVQQLGNNAKWDFLPWPSFPARKVGKLHDNFFGMLKTAPNKELAWELLRWAAIDPEWQTFYMSLALAPPAIASLLQQWYAVMRATAPVLKDKHLEYWGDPTLNGEGVYDYEFFKYDPTKANNVLSSVWSQMWGQKTDVTTGFTQIATQIDQIEVAGAATAQSLAKATQQFPTQGPAIAPVPFGI